MVVAKLSVVALRDPAASFRLEAPLARMYTSSPRTMLKDTCCRMPLAPEGNIKHDSVVVSSFWLF